MLIIYEGKVEILVNGKKVAEQGPHMIIGEKALEHKQTRTATVVALQKCKCLAIYKVDYDKTLALLKTQHKKQNQNILRKMQVIGDWDFIKIKGFSRELSEIQFP